MLLLLRLLLVAWCCRWCDLLNAGIVDKLHPQGLACSHQPVSDLQQKGKACQWPYWTQ